MNNEFNEMNKVVEGFFDYTDSCIRQKDFAEVNSINPSEFDKKLNALLKEFEDLPKEELAVTLRFYLDVVRLDDLRERKPVRKQEATGTLKYMLDHLDEEELSEEREKMLDSLKTEYEKGVHDTIERACRWLKRTQHDWVMPDTTIDRLKLYLEEQQ